MKGLKLERFQHLKKDGLNWNIHSNNLEELSVSPKVSKNGIVQCVNWIMKQENIWHVKTALHMQDKIFI